MHLSSLTRSLLVSTLAGICTALPQGTGPAGPVCTGAARSAQIAKVEAIPSSRGYSACSSTLGLYVTSTKTNTVYTATTTATNVKLVSKTAQASTQVSTQEVDVTDVSTQFETTQVTIVGPLSTLVILDNTYTITGTYSLTTVATE